MTNTRNPILVQVQEHYAAAATGAATGATSCCGPENTQWGTAHYDDLTEIPDAAALASLGCGNPIAVADLHLGETVLDLGSGGERAERGSYVGCIAGALPITQYETGLGEAGFVDVSITFTNTVGDGVHSAIVRAVKPSVR